MLVVHDRDDGVPQSSLHTSAMWATRVATGAAASQGSSRGAAPSAAAASRPAGSHAGAHAPPAAASYGSMDDDRAPEAADYASTGGAATTASEADSIRQSLEAVAALPDLPQTLAGLTAWVQRQFADAASAAAAAAGAASTEGAGARFGGVGPDGPPGVAAAVSRLRILASSRTLGLLAANCIKQGVAVPPPPPATTATSSIIDDSAVPVDPREEAAIDAFAHLLIPPGAARAPASSSSGSAGAEAQAVSSLSELVAFTKPAATVLVRQCGVIAAALGTSHQAALTAALGQQHAGTGGGGSATAASITANQNALYEAAADAAGASIAAAASAYRSAIGGSLTSLAGATALEAKARGHTGQLLSAHSKLSEALAAAEAKRMAASSASGVVADPVELAASAATASSVLRAALARRDAAAAALEAALARSNQLLQLAIQGSDASGDAVAAVGADFASAATALAGALNALPVPGAGAGGVIPDVGGRMAVVVGSSSGSTGGAAASSSIAVPTIVVAPDVLGRLRKEDTEAHAQAEAVESAIAAACGPMRSELSHVTTSLSALEARRAALLKELAGVDDSIRGLSAERSRLQEVVDRATGTLRPRIVASETRLAATTSAVAKADAVAAVGGAVAAAMATAAAAAAQIKGAAAVGAGGSGAEADGSRPAPAVALPREALTSTLRSALTYARTEEGMVRALRARAARSGASAVAHGAEAQRYRSVGMSQFAGEAATKAEAASKDAAQDAASVAHLTGVAGKLLASVEGALVPVVAALRRAVASSSSSGSSGGSTGALTPVDLALVLAVQAAITRGELRGSEGSSGPWGAALLAAAGHLPFSPTLSPAEIVAGLCGAMGWSVPDAAAAGLSEADLSIAALPPAALAGSAAEAASSNPVATAALAELMTALLALPVPPLLPDAAPVPPHSGGGAGSSNGARPTAPAAAPVQHHHHHHHHHHATAPAAVGSAAPFVLPLGLPSSTGPVLLAPNTSSAAAALMSPGRQGHPRRAIRPAEASGAGGSGAPALGAGSGGGSGATPRKAGGKAGATPMKLVPGGPGVALPQPSRLAPWSPTLRRPAAASSGSSAVPPPPDADFPALPARSGGGR